MQRGASLKLKGATTFPAWVESADNGTIFDDKVKCPDLKTFGRLVADYIVWLSKKDIALDFMGMNNKVNEELKAKRHVETAKVLMEEPWKRGLDTRFCSFQFVATSVRYAEAIGRFKRPDGSTFERRWETEGSWVCIARLIHQRGSSLHGNGATPMRLRPWSASC
jgi:hypothetical protein